MSNFSELRVKLKELQALLFARAERVAEVRGCYNPQAGSFSFDEDRFFVEVDPDDGDHGAPSFSIELTFSQVEMSEEEFREVFLLKEEEAQKDFNLRKKIETRARLEEKLKRLNE